MADADRVIRWSTALAVLGVAMAAAAALHEHADDLVQAHGESGWTGRLVPLTAERAGQRASSRRSGANPVAQKCWPATRRSG